MMARYAQNTEVSSERSRGEIEKTLSRYGATSFAYGTEEGRAMVAFTMQGRQVRFVLPMPRKDAFRQTEGGRARKSENAVTEAWEQACRQRWRALALVVKAKLEAVECGISEFEREFLANIVLPGGGMLGDMVIPQVAEAYKTGRAPSLFLLGEGQ